MDESTTPTSIICSAATKHQNQSQQEQIKIVAAGTKGRGAGIHSQLLQVHQVPELCWNSACDLVLVKLPASVQKKTKRRARCLMPDVLALVFQRAC